LNGVDFRAVGNEPGWHLEIRNKDKTLFVGDYGEFRLEFPTPDPYTIQEKRRTIYQTDVDGKNILVVIEGRQCRDTMSGESFSVAVDVTINKKTYRGCGRALH
jgi:putative lipoprotein